MQILSFLGPPTIQETDLDYGALKVVQIWTYPEDLSLKMVSHTDLSELRVQSIRVGPAHLAELLENAVEYGPTGNISASAPKRPMIIGPPD